MSNKEISGKIYIYKKDPIMIFILLQVNKSQKVKLAEARKNLTRSLYQKIKNKEGNPLGLKILQEKRKTLLKTELYTIKLKSLKE